MKTNQILHNSRQIYEMQLKNCADSLPIDDVFIYTLLFLFPLFIPISFGRLSFANSTNKSLDNRLLDQTYELKSLNLKLSVENEQIRSGNVGSSNGTSAMATAKISQLETKLLAQQEQLTDLHKRKGENSQMIIDLNLKLEKQTKLLGEREHRFELHWI